MMKYLIIILLTLNVYSVAFGQILNADKFGKNTDTTRHWNGNAAVGFTINKQKDLLFNVSTNADVAYLFRRNVLILAGAYSFFRSGEEWLINSGFAHLRYRKGYDRKFTPEFFAQIQYDDIRGLRERELAGADLRYRIYNTTKGYFFVAGGLMFEREIWDHSGVEGSPTITDPLINDYIKITSYISFQQKISDNVKFNLIAYYQARPDYFFNPRVSGEAELAFSITKNLTFSSYFNANYDSDPPVPIENLYYTFRNNLKIAFK